MAYVTIRDVSKEYVTGDGRRVFALDKTSLDLADGEFVCVVGHSGCGKTTLLNILAGFLEPTTGTILIDGKSSKDFRDRVGIVFQEYALFPWQTALENIEFGLEMHGMSKEERVKHATNFLKLVKLEDFAHVYPHQLSGGMRQRVAVARALAYEPALLLMDEPFGALDAQTRERLQALTEEIWLKTKKTVFYVTHNLGEAVYLADKIVVMQPHPGRIMEIVEVTQARPRDPLSKDFTDVQRHITDLIKGHATEDVL